MADKKKKKVNLHELSASELEKQLGDAREELMKLRFQQATGELTDFTRITYTRRQIARLITILAAQQREAMLGGK